MLNRFIARCNVAHWLCQWNLLFVCLPLHQQRDMSTICHAAPHQHRSVLEYLTSVPLTQFTDMCGRLIPADTDAKMSASANLWKSLC